MGRFESCNFKLKKKLYDLPMPMFEVERKLWRYGGEVMREVVICKKKKKWVFIYDLIIYKIIYNFNKLKGNI